MWSVGYVHVSAAAYGDQQRMLDSPGAGVTGLVEYFKNSLVHNKSLVM